MTKNNPTWNVAVDYLSLPAIVSGATHFGADSDLHMVVFLDDADHTIASFAREHVHSITRLAG